MKSFCLALLSVTFTGAMSCATKSAPPPPPPAQLEYHLKIDPAAREVIVSGLIRNAMLADIESWKRPAADYSPSFGEPDTVFETPEGVGFRSRVELTDPEELKSAEALLDAQHLRAWGWSLFPTPVSKIAVNRMVVRIEAPDDWGVITSLGGERMQFEVPTLKDLRSMAVFAGDLRVRTFHVDDVPVTLVLRQGYPANLDDAYEQALRALVRASTSYLGAVPVERLMFGFDLRDERPSYAPGNNVSTRAQSTTLFIRKPDEPQDAPGFVGAVAHEFAHTWIPHAFGDVAVTTGELGPVFTEGFVDYVAYRLTYAAGLHSESDFTRSLSRFLLDYLFVAGPGREQNAGALPYVQGMVAAWLLDITLLRVSEGRYDLGDFLRLLLEQHANTDGLTRQELHAALRHLGGVTAVEAYERLTSTEGTLDVNAHLRGTGIRVQPFEDVREVRRALRAGGPPVVTFQPETVAEREFLSRFLAPRVAGR